MIPRDRRFLRLLVVRVTGQTGDGVFQAALASYALFGDDVAGAADLRCGRRGGAAALLAAGAARRGRARPLVAAPGAAAGQPGPSRGAGAPGRAVLAADCPDPVVYAVALVALGVNRFLLAGLSASLPHTVAPRLADRGQRRDPHRGHGWLRGGAGGGGAAAERVVGRLARATTVLIARGRGGLRRRRRARALLLPRRLLGPDRLAGRRRAAGRTRRACGRPAPPAAHAAVPAAALASWPRCGCGSAW